MPRVRFTQNIQRHIACPEGTADGTTVAMVLEGYFATNAKARGYVLDDQGRLRRHIAVFVDGRPMIDRVGLRDSVSPTSTIDVMQALSGG